MATYVPASESSFRSPYRTFVRLPRAAGPVVAAPGGLAAAGPLGTPVLLVGTVGCDAPEVPGPAHASKIPSENPAESSAAAACRKARRLDCERRAWSFEPSVGGARTPRVYTGPQPQPGTAGNRLRNCLERR